MNPQELIFFPFVHKNLMAEICETRLMTGTSIFQAHACKRTEAVGELSAADPDLNILTHLPGKSCLFYIILKELRI